MGAPRRCLRAGRLPGAGRSPGRIDISSRETQDLYHCIEWAAVQPWSSGKVGLNGISYFAMNQWHVASLQPPHLAAMCSREGAADFYRDLDPALIRPTRPYHSHDEYQPLVRGKDRWGAPTAGAAHRGRTRLKIRVGERIMVYVE